MWSGSEKVWSETEGCGQRVRACPCGGGWSCIRGCGQAHLCDGLWPWLQQRGCACLYLRLHLHLAAGLYRRVWGGQYGAGGRLWEGLHRSHGSAPHLIHKEIREIPLITDKLQHL